MAGKIFSLFTPSEVKAHLLPTLPSDRVRVIMADTAIAIAPCIFWSTYVYSVRTLLVLLVCVGVFILSDLLCSFAFTGRIYGALDLSSLIYGALTACLLAPGADLLHCAFIALVCSLLLRHFLTFIARSPIHPVAAAAALFSLLSYFSGEFAFTLPFSSEAGATVPDMIVGESTHTLMWYDLLFGKVCAPLGCASALLIIAGGIYLSVRRIIDIRIPLACIVGACVAAYLLSANANPFFDVLFIGLCGQMLFCAFFLCADRTYAPHRRQFSLPYGALCGALGVFLCFKLSTAAAFPLAVVIANLAARVLDALPIRQKPFGKL
ncbi:MAG: RnfABCDGE type electron transport complex subunit D [Clostridia bacterium]|nr:RnfABCDGE type electron transport complex subunit D [Clostridia bacterium]